MSCHALLGIRGESLHQYLPISYQIWSKQSVSIRSRLSKGTIDFSASMQCLLAQSQAQQLVYRPFEKTHIAAASRIERLHMHWKVVVCILAAIRTLMSLGDEFVTKYKRDSLRILGTVGEPINPEAWKWYRNVSCFFLEQLLRASRYLDTNFSMTEVPLDWISMHSTLLADPDESLNSNCYDWSR